MSYLLSVPADDGNGWRLVERQIRDHMIGPRGERRTVMEVRDQHGRLVGRWDTPPQVGSRLPPLEWD